MLRGRAFTDQDNAAAPRVVIINQAMAKRYWPNGDPLADRITIGGGLGPRMELVGHQIVGIVGDVRDAAPEPRSAARSCTFRGRRCPTRTAQT